MVGDRLSLPQVLGHLKLKADLFHCILRFLRSAYTCNSVVALDTTAHFKVGWVHQIETI